MWARLRRLWRGRDLSQFPVIIYTRSNCPLCDEAKHFVERERSRLGFPLQLLDIDADARLNERYGDCVPVVEIAGRERFRGRINPVLWARIWRAGG